MPYKKLNYAMKTCGGLEVKLHVLLPWHFMDVGAKLHTLAALLPVKELTEPFRSCSASQEFPSILCNPKVHYHVHNTLPLAPILSQNSLVHTIPSYLEINFNTVELGYNIIKGT
jgi:hypothetical protein